jgi:gliding motility-associated-like protein
VCQGEDVTFTISLTGGIQGDYQFNYLLDGQADSVILSSPGGLEITFQNVQDSFGIELESFYPLDNAVCVYDAGASWQVNVMPPPTAGTPLQDVVLCQSTDSLVVLADLLQGETLGGSWVLDVGNAPGFNASAGTQATGNMAPGTYTYTYTASGMGICPDSEASVAIVINPTPTVDAGDDQELSCNMGMVSLGSGSNPTGPGFTYTWTSGTPGVVIANPNTLILETGQPGTYTLTVEDPNGCTNSDQVVAIPNLEAPSPSFSFTDPSCHGDTDGTILIDSIVGGVPPFQVMLNGQNMGSQASFFNLGDGEYTLTVTGANGCFVEQDFTLVEPEPMTANIRVSLDTIPLVIEFGDSLLLTAETNSTAPIDTFIWRPAGQGQSFWFAPLETSTVDLTVIDLNGCSASDQILVIVEKNRDVFVPNIFSPNDDGRNDRFYIQSGPQVVEIEEFAVYTRWGEAVFEAFNIEANDPINGGWDGTHRGELMNSDVFVWYAVIRYNDGETAVIKGDVVLMR